MAKPRETSAAPAPGPIAPQVQEVNLKRLDDEIDILKSYLKTQGAPKNVIDVLEGLTVEQHVSWKKAVDRIKKLLEE
jgi:hypothetical protein